MHVFRLVCALLFVPAFGVSAQQGPPTASQQGFGVISGSVLDSLRGGLLVGGVVAVDGAPRSAMTDSVGMFTIDSVPGGEYRLVLLDAILDTIGLSVESRPLTVTPGDTTFIVFALPSPATVVRAKCGAGPFPAGTSALLGMVIDAETEQPIGGADIVLAWSEVQATRETGLRTLPRQRTAKADANGTFRICGLPGDITAELVAWSGRDTTAVLRFVFAHPQLAIRTIALSTGSHDSLAVAAPAVTGQPATGSQRAPGRRGRAVMRGVVTTLGGRPIEGARVSVGGTEGTALTDSRGAFVLDGQPSGSQTVLVRRLGYEPAEFAVNLSPSRETEIAVELPDFVPVLSTVVVRAEVDVALDRIGFTHRQRVGMGRFMTLEEIDRRNATHLVDLLADFPMLQARSTGGTRRVITGRTRGMGTNCVNFIVDGQPWMGDDAPTDFMHPQELGAVEAYSAATAPAEFARTGTSCETVAIWTKHKLGIR